ncbi:hypothetical protein FDZ71_00025 [bacterium]|nr:MAG: hypothetical protein FDZ71_00025 [bacterium]
MNKPLGAKQLGVLGGIWFALFSGFWVFLDPLGGMAILQRAGSSTWYVYTTVLVFTLLVSVSAYFVSAADQARENSDPLLLGASRSEYDYMSLLAASKKEIYLLGLSLPTFSLESKLEFLRGKIREGVRVRVLLMNPFSVTVQQRPERLYEISIGVAEACVSTLSVLIKLRNGMAPSEQARLQIAVTNVHPSVGVIGNESQVMWSPYLANHTGARSPFLVHDLNKSAVAVEVFQHFETMWQMDALEMGNSTSVEDLKAFAERDGLPSAVVPQNVVTTLVAVLDGRTR